MRAADQPVKVGAAIDDRRRGIATLDGCTQRRTGFAHTA